jgi:hypothetical protein
MDFQTAVFSIRAICVIRGQKDRAKAQEPRITQTARIKFPCHHVFIRAIRVIRVLSGSVGFFAVSSALAPGTLARL